MWTQTFFRRGIALLRQKWSTEHVFVRRVFSCGRLQSAHVLCSSWECTRGAFTLLLLVVITLQLSICICEHFHVLPVPCPYMQRPGIKKALFRVRLFECGDASGEGEFVTSPADHLQFVSANQTCVVLVSYVLVARYGVWPLSV